MDDADEVFLNAKPIGGGGALPPDYESAYNMERTYPIPSGMIDFDGDNVIAVRVFDAWQVGGIYEGPIGLVTRQHYRRRNYRHT